MKYRAMLLGVPNLERPVQKYGQLIEPLEAWAKNILKDYEDTGVFGPHVMIYELREVSVAIRYPEHVGVKKDG